MPPRERPSPKRLLMSHIRLIGLLLFITAITLALAAAATQTTHVQVSSQWGLLLQGASQSTASESSTTIPPAGSTPTDYTNVQMPPASGGPQFPPIPAASEDPYARDSHVHDWDYAAHQARFNSTAIPIAWPLLATGGAGLLLWFIQAPAELRPSPKKRSTKRKRRR